MRKLMSSMMLWLVALPSSGVAGAQGTLRMVNHADLKILDPNLDHGEDHSQLGSGLVPDDLVK